LPSPPVFQREKRKSQKGVNKSCQQKEHFHFIIDISKYIQFCSSIHSLNMALKGSAKLFPSLFSKPRGVTVIGASSKTGKRDKGFLISISESWVDLFFIPILLRCLFFIFYLFPDEPTISYLTLFI
jgi:hypothetical protein